jgi:hypothetical protein
MHDLLIESSTEICTAEQKRNFYDQCIPTIFDRRELNSKEHLFSTPMCCKKHSKDNYANNVVSSVKKEDNDTHSLDEKNKKTENSKHIQEYQKEVKENIINLDDGRNNVLPGNIGPEKNNEESLDLELQAVLARLVSDYRAIFAIEDEIYHGESHCLPHPSTSYQEVHNIRIEPDVHSNTKWHSSEHLNPIVDHEHRKRHEEEDDCPEEIKSMKVACEELSLECNFTMGNLTSATDVSAKNLLSDIQGQKKWNTKREGEFWPSLLSISCSRMLQKGELPSPSHSRRTESSPSETSCKPQPPAQ